MSTPQIASPTGPRASPAPSVPSSTPAITDFSNSRNTVPHHPLHNHVALNISGTPETVVVKAPAPQNQSPC
ncbi:hypothetical protein BGZ94_009520, partial [Podila epigama]